MELWQRQSRQSPGDSIERLRGYIRETWGEFLANQITPALGEWLAQHWPQSSQSLRGYLTNHWGKWLANQITPVLSEWLTQHWPQSSQGLGERFLELLDAARSGRQTGDREGVVTNSAMLTKLIAR